MPATSGARLCRRRSARSRRRRRILAIKIVHSRASCCVLTSPALELPSAAIRNSRSSAASLATAAPVMRSSMPAFMSTMLELEGLRASELCESSARTSNRTQKLYSAATGADVDLAGVFCDADAVGQGLLTGFLPCQTHLVDGELCLGGALGGSSPTQGERDVHLELRFSVYPGTPEPRRCLVKR
jgi:hypothetical protein